MRSVKLNKEMIVPLAVVVLMVLFVAGGTFAYIRAQISGSSISDIEATTGTTDSLMFDKGKDLDITATQANFGKGKGNLKDTSTLKATLRVNNTLPDGEEAKYNYYTYIDIKENDFKYTTKDKQPELVLVIKKPDNTYVESITGLPKAEVEIDNQKVKGIDITEAKGLIKLTENGYEIKGTRSAVVEQTWEITIVFVNLDSEQTANEGKSFQAEGLMQRENKEQSIVDSSNSDITDENGESVGKIEDNVIRPTYKVNEETKESEREFTIYSVGYIRKNSKNNITSSYTINLNNLGIDIENYELEVISKGVMTTKEEYEEHARIKKEGMIDAGKTNEADAKATIEEKVRYSLTEEELTVGEIQIECSESNKCTATINKIINLQEGREYHNTTLNNGEAVEVAYVGLKFTIREKKNNAFHNKCNEKTLACTIAKKQGTIQGKGKLLYHNTSLINGANDNSYRYSGDNPNNFVCFGSDNSRCPEENMYRIIGVFDIDGSEKVKLVKSEYVTKEELGDWGEHTYGDSLVGLSVNSSYMSIARIQTKSGINGFHWSNNASNTWSTSTLNTVALNQNYLNELGTWANKIAPSTWYVSGYDTYDVTAKAMRDAEIGSSLQVKDTKIGLMYVSDYGYATTNDNGAWEETLYNYDSSEIKNQENNWLFNGVFEWLISPYFGFNFFGSSYTAYIVSNTGSIYFSVVKSNDIYIFAHGVRPSFYLNFDVAYASGDGSHGNPYRIVI